MALQAAADVAQTMMPCLPDLRDKTACLNATKEALKRFKIPLSVTNVQGVAVAAPSGSSKMPAIVFVDNDGKTYDKFVVVAKASGFDPFGPLINEKQPGGMAPFLDERKGTLHFRTRMSTSGTSAHTIESTVREFLPYYNETHERPQLFEKFSTTIVVEHPKAVGIEHALWAATHAHSIESPGRLLPAPTMALPSKEELMADFCQTSAVKKPLGFTPPLCMGARVTTNGSAFPIQLKFIRRIKGVVLSKDRADKQAKKEFIHVNFPDVVAMLFGDSDIESIPSTAGALESLKNCAGVLRDMHREIPELDFSRVGDFFQSLADEEVYAMSVPQIYGPDGQLLTMRELYEIGYKRHPSLAPLVGFSCSYGTPYMTDGKVQATIRMEYERVTFLGYVQATPSFGASVDTMDDKAAERMALEMFTDAPEPSDDLAIEALETAMASIQGEEQTNKRPAEDDGEQKKKKQRTAK